MKPILIKSGGFSQHPTLATQCVHVHVSETVFTIFIPSSTAKPIHTLITYWPPALTIPVHDFYLPLPLTANLPPPPTHTHTLLDLCKASCTDVYTCYKSEYTHPTSSFKEEVPLPRNTNSTFYVKSLCHFC